MPEPTRRKPEEQLTDEEGKDEVFNFGTRWLRADGPRQWAEQTARKARLPERWPVLSAGSPREPKSGNRRSGGDYPIGVLRPLVFSAGGSSLHNEIIRSFGAAERIEAGSPPVATATPEKQ